MVLIFPRAISQRMISHTVLIFILFICPVASIIVQSHYLAVLDLTDTIEDNDLLGYYFDTSLIMCALMCQDKCTCFGYHKAGRCRLRGQCLLDSEVGWQYFRKVQEHTDCQTLYSERAVRLSGVYMISPQGRGAHPVYCDMSTEGGGWTISFTMHCCIFVILKRTDGSVDFTKNWDAYKKGFGNASSEYWIGNEMIHLLTSHDPSLLYVMIRHVNGTTFYQTYNGFSVASEYDGYKLAIGDTSGTLGDSIMPGVDPKLNLDGMLFSTVDRDQDADNMNNCASLYRGGWWFNACHYAFLTGPFMSSDWFKPWYPVFTHGNKVQAVIMMTKRESGITEISGI